MASNPDLPIGTRVLILHNLGNTTTAHPIVHRDDHYITSEYTSFSIGTFEGVEDIDILDDDTEEILDTLHNVPKLLIPSDTDTDPGTTIYGYECYWTKLTPKLETICNASPPQYKYPRGKENARDLVINPPGQPPLPRTPSISELTTFLKTRIRKYLYQKNT